MQCGVYLNNMCVFPRDMERVLWSSDMFNERVREKIGDELVKRLFFTNLHQTAEITNELFSAAAQLATPETGFESLTFNFFDYKDGLDWDVLKQFAQKLTHVKSFRIENMPHVGRKIRP